MVVGNSEIHIQIESCVELSDTPLGVPKVAS